MSAQLSSGALTAINDGQQIDKPVFQLLALKKLNPAAATNNTVDRYRIMLSDGVHNNTAMLAVQLNQMVAAGQLEPNTVIRLDRYVCNKLAGNRRVVIILELTVVLSGNQVGGKIGNPVALPLSGGGGTNGQQAQAPQHTPQQQPSMRAGASPMGVAKANSFPSASGSFNKQGNYGGAGPSSGMSPPKQAQPISSLTPYQNRWTIKARVSSKSNIRTWSNSRGEGKLFSMDLCDQSGEIRATAFKEQCDKFYDLIEIGKVFFISRGTLKTANRQYTSITNDYEMTFNNDTTVVPCEEEDDSIPTMQFDFRAIGQLEDMNKDAILDTTDGERVANSSTAAAKPTATVTPVAVLAPMTSSQAPGPPIQPLVQAHQVAFIRPMSEGIGPNQQMLPGYPVLTSQRAPGPGVTQQTFTFRGAAPVVRFVHHHHSVPGPRVPPQLGPPRTTSSVTGTTSGTATTSTVAGPGQAFHIHFHHRPGYPPQPVIRLVQDVPTPPPGVHRCTHAHHGQPVFRTPTPATAAQSTPAPPTRTRISTQSPSRPVVPAAAAAATAASSSAPKAQQATSGQGSVLPQRKPGPQDDKPDDQPELAELAQRIRNISADVKTIKPGSRGVPLDPREKQRKEAAEASSERRKEIKAKTKTLQTEEAAADSQNVKGPESTNIPALDVDASEISSSSNDSIRRRKRRKRGKQQSQTPVESQQNSISKSVVKDVKTNCDPEKEESVLEDTIQPEVEMESLPKPDDEEYPARDSDDTSSESDSEEAPNVDKNPKENKPCLIRASPEPTCPIVNGAVTPSGADDTLESNHKSEITDVIQLSSEPSNVVMDNVTAPNTEQLTNKQSSTEACRDHGSSAHSTKQLTSSITENQEGTDPDSSLEAKLAPETQADPPTNSEEMFGSRSQSDPVAAYPMENSHEETAAMEPVQETIKDEHSSVEIQPEPSVNHGHDYENQKPHERVPGPGSATVVKAPNVRSSFDAQSQASVKTSDTKSLESGDVSQKSSKHNALSSTFTKEADKTLSSRPDTVGFTSIQRPSGDPCVESSETPPSSEQHSQRDRSTELQRDHFKLERKQLGLDRQRLDCERQNLLLKEERLQIEQDRLQAERERLATMREQVRLQRDQLELDRNRLDLERDHLEVNRECLQVERHRLQGEEQRGEDSKMILQSLQEISQTLQMSVNISLQGYGLPMSYEMNGGGADEYMQQQSFLEDELQGAWPEETSNLREGAVAGGTFNPEEEIPEDSGDEWTVVGRTRASSRQCENAHLGVQDWSAPEGSAASQGTVDDFVQSVWVPEQAALTTEMPLDSSTQQVHHSAKTEPSTKEPSETVKGKKPVMVQKSGEGRSLSPVQGLSSIQGRQGIRPNPNRREYRQGRPDGRRGRDRKHYRPNEPKTDPKK